MPNPSNRPAEIPVKELIAIGEQLKAIQEINLTLQARLGQTIDSLIDIHGQISANDKLLLALHQRINDIASKILPDWRAMAKGGKE